MKIDLSFQLNEEHQPTNTDSDDSEEEESANETIVDTSSKNRNITELLFHPANFDNKEMKMMMRTDHEAVKFAEDMEKMDMSAMNATHFHNMMFDIQNIYKKINEKLQVKDLLYFICYNVIRNNANLNTARVICFIFILDVGSPRKYDC